jgi:serine/threonine-protein kinase
MSPEQALGRSDIDHRSDLWSFCVMLYEAVTGTAPFFNDNCNATLFAITSQSAPSLASLGFDEALSKILERGMEKERDARWPSASELADVLSRWLVQQGFESDVAGISLRRRFLDQGEPAVLRELPEERPNDRSDTIYPERKQRWAGPVALVSTLAAIGVLVVVALSARESTLSGGTEPGPTVVARPEPAPPVPVSENVRTDATVSSPTRGDAARDAGADAAPSPEATTPARRLRTAKLPEPPLFPAASPFTPSGSAPESAGADRVRAPTPPAKLPARSRSRIGGPPGRDYGI